MVSMIATGSLSRSGLFFCVRTLLDFCNSTCHSGDLMVGCTANYTPPLAALSSRPIQYLARCHSCVRRCHELDTILT